MEKPTKKNIECWEYIKCRNYLQEKYGYDERNYSGKKFTEAKDDSPYQDFWHFVINRVDIHNGAFFYMDNEWLDYAEEAWQKEILEHYLSEFGEGKEREIYFYVEW